MQDVIVPGAEITPVRSVDKITIGEGKRGPITERLQKLFFGLFDDRALRDA